MAHRLAERCGSGAGGRAETFGPVGTLAGLAELIAAAGITLAEVADVVHGTTLVPNALIERRGAKLGLITTQGFATSWI